MKTSAFKYTLLYWVSTAALIIILLIPFHAFLTVWGSSLVGHYTALRLWKEVLLVICAAAALFLIVSDHKIRSHTLSRRLVWLILGYMGLSIIWGVISLTGNEVTLKALGYGLIVNLRFLAFFLITWAVALRLARLRVAWQWIVLWPAAIVIIFGLLQAFVLPTNFLNNFGYHEAATIAPYETVNNNPEYIRVASTLRGANPLGAYLLIPISLFCILILRGKRQKLYGAALAAALILQFFTYSRSALIGSLLAIGTIVVLSVRSAQGRKVMAYSAAGLVTVLAVMALVWHDNPRFQNIVFHTEDNSQVARSSNDDRENALRSGLSEIGREPLGEGPGTAGPASVYNDNKTKIAENYYVQIAQETGWLGLGLFLLITAGVGYLLWLRRDHPLALSLFASLVGLTFINLLSHAWTDDTLAYIWWGLAGIAMAPGLSKEE